MSPGECLLYDDSVDVVYVIDVARYQGLEVSRLTRPTVYVDVETRHWSQAHDAEKHQTTAKSQNDSSARISGVDIDVFRDRRHYMPGFAAV